MIPQIPRDKLIKNIRPIKLIPPQCKSSHNISFEDTINSHITSTNQLDNKNMNVNKPNVPYPNLIQPKAKVQSRNTSPSKNLKNNSNNNNSNNNNSNLDINNN